MHTCTSIFCVMTHFDFFLNYSMSHGTGFFELFGCHYYRKLIIKVNSYILHKCIYSNYILYHKNNHSNTLLPDHESKLNMASHVLKDRRNQYMIRPLRQTKSAWNTATTLLSLVNDKIE